MATTLSFASYPVAVNCCVWSAVIVAVGGATVMVASGPGFTVTEALPLLPLALAYTVQAPTVVPVNRPAPLMFPPPFRAHVCVIGGTTGLFHASYPRSE